jgi:hypothetical protein
MTWYASPVSDQSFEAKFQKQSTKFFMELKSTKDISHPEPFPKLVHVVENRTLTVVVSFFLYAISLLKNRSGLSPCEGTRLGKMAKYTKALLFGILAITITAFVVSLVTNVVLLDTRTSAHTTSVSEVNSLRQRTETFPLGGFLPSSVVSGNISGFTTLPFGEIGPGKYWASIWET